MLRRTEQKDISLNSSGTPRAVIFAAHPWAGTPYGLHHISRALAKLGWKVLYVEPYFSLLHIFTGRVRGRILQRTFRLSEFEDIYLISPFAAIPHINVPILRANFILKLASRFYWPHIPNSIASSIFDKPDLVINGDARASSWALSLNAKIVSYRIADDNRLFDVITPAIRKREKKMLAQYDIILATSSQLVTQAWAAGARNVLLMSNGVDYSLFDKRYPQPDDIAPLPKPRILYVGAIENWFDWETLIEAAVRRPSYMFIIIGNNSATSKITLPKNVKLFGRRSYALIPAYMQASDVGIIPFQLRDSDQLISSINPLKLYEYLAAGLPVVSSIGPSNVKSEALFIYRNIEEFIECLDRSLYSFKKSRIKIHDQFDWTGIISKLLKELHL